MAGSRYIPPALAQHLAGDMTTVCWLLRVIPVTPGYASYGITELDQDVRYDDGGGELLYSAAIGMVPAAVLQTAGLEVNNTELPALLPEYDVPISEVDIRAGVYDFATFVLYLVNWSDLSMGHCILHAGSLGQVSINADGLSFVNELRGLAAKLKQSVCSKDSLTCRAIFGSQPPGSATPGPQVARDWCGYAAEGELQAGVVGSVGLENTRTFTVSDASGWTVDMLAPGIVIWDTGLNAGRTYEVEGNDVGGQIDLAFETAFPINVGDQLRYRPDCTKGARDEEKGCKFWFGSEWVLHFRGEPDIPVGDASALATPGASSGPGQGGRTTQPMENAE